MKIGIISDTHDHLDNIDQAIGLLAEAGVAMICHCGDWVAPYSVDRVATKAQEYDIPVRGVLGNNDGEVYGIISSNPEQWHITFGHETHSFEADGRKIILYHGTDRDLTNGLIAGGAFDAVFSGHTHEQRNEAVGETLALNPGTLSGFAPNRGQLRVGEYALYDTETNTANLHSFAL